MHVVRAAGAIGSRSGSAMALGEIRHDIHPAMRGYRLVNGAPLLGIWSIARVNRRLIGFALFSGSFASEVFSQTSSTRSASSASKLAPFVQRLKRRAASWQDGAFATSPNFSSRPVTGQSPASAGAAERQHNANPITKLRNMTSPCGLA